MQDEKKKREEREKKKAEVRARLEAASAKSQKKKGFMTPERKKRLRVSERELSLTLWTYFSEFFLLISSKQLSRNNHQKNKKQLLLGLAASQGGRGAEAPTRGQG